MSTELSPAQLIEKLVAWNSTNYHDHHWEPKPNLAESQQHAAILFHGGPEDSDEREILETYDFWAYTTDPAIICAADDNRLIMADSQHELQTLVEARNPTHPNCLLVEFARVEITTGLEEKVHGWRRRRRRYHERTKLAGWVVLKTPKLRESLEEDQVRDFCVEHGPVLMDSDDIRHAFGSEEGLMAAGFSPIPGEQGYTKVFFNPKAVVLRKWRKMVRETEAKFVTQFPNHIMLKLGYVVNPTNWPSSMPFANLIDGVKGRQRGGGWHSTYRDDPEYDASIILEYIKLARALKKGSTPWRSNCTSQLKDAIRDGAPYIRFIIKNGKYDTDKAVARWLLREAKIAEIAVPSIPQVPAKPSFRKRKKATKRAAKPFTIADVAAAEPAIPTVAVPELVAA